MPTIDQLSQATAASDTDEFVVSQNGVARKIMRDQIIAGLQPSIATDSGTLLGRLSAGSGGPETVIVGNGLNLTANGLAVTTPFAVDPLPATSNVADADLVPVSQSGQLTKATRAQLVAGLQPAISLSSGSLLGRNSAGTGGPEAVAPGDGLTLSSGVLSATPIETLPINAVPAATDLFLTRTAGVSHAISYQDLITGISAVPGVDLSAATATPNLATNRRTLAQRFADLINVLDFGAVGDGITDDTAVIQNAINVAQQNGTQVFFPAGNYCVSSLTISGSLMIRGSGMNATTLVCIAGTTQPMMQIRLTGGTQYDKHRPVEIENLTLMGNKTDPAGNNLVHGLDFQNASSNPRSDIVFCRNVQFAEFPGNGVNGISWTGAAQFINCTFNNNNYINLNANTCNDWKFHECLFGSAGTYSVQISGCSGFSFFDGGIYSSSGSGLYLFGGAGGNTNNSWVGVSFDNNQKNGIEVDVRSNTNNMFIGCNFGSNSKGSPGTYSDIYVHSNSGKGLSICNSRFAAVQADYSTGTALNNIQFADATCSPVIFLGNIIVNGALSSKNISNHPEFLLMLGDYSTGISAITGNAGLNLSIAGATAATFNAYGTTFTNNGPVTLNLTDGSQSTNFKSFHAYNGYQTLKIECLNDNGSVQWTNLCYDHSGNVYAGGTKGYSSVKISQTSASSNTSANWMELKGSAGGGTPYLKADGTDANISFSIAAKGTGAVQIGVSTNSIGFFGSAGVVKPTVAGAKGGNAALASLLAALVSLGLVLDNTTA